MTVIYPVPCFESLRCFWLLHTQGIVYVVRPPDLRREPRREAFAEDKESQPAAACRSVLGAAASFGLTPEAQDSWSALAKLHSDAPHSGAVPKLPACVQVPGANGTSRTYVGSPCLLHPILKAMRRFARPHITWDPFSDEPPDHFPDGAASASNQDVEPLPASDTLRDVRAANNVVHQGYSAAQQARDAAGLSDQDWLEGTSSRLEEVHPDRLYIVSFQCDNSDLQVALVRSLAAVAGKQGRMNCLWFDRSKNAPFEWPKTVVFREHSDVPDEIEIESFLLEVDIDTDLTKGSRAHWKTAPVLDHNFVRRLRLFAQRDGFLIPNPHKRGSAGGGKKGGGNKTGSNAKRSKK